MEKNEESKYPYIGEHTDGSIVLFTGHKKGVTLRIPYENISEIKYLDYRIDWIESNFTTLEQEYILPINFEGFPKILQYKTTSCCKIVFFIRENTGVLLINTMKDDSDYIYRNDALTSCYNNKVWSPFSW